MITTTLTKRETEVRDLLLAGHTRRGCANTLGISRGSINRYVDGVFSYYCIHSVGELAAAVQRDAEAGR